MKKIVLVNDNADFLIAMEILLKDAGGYNPIIIHESHTAFQTIKKEAPDLIILDIRMEEPTAGWKILDVLTLDPETSNIPVIICSASADRITPEKLEWLKMHQIAVLPKPFDVSDMLTMVEGMLKGKVKQFLASEPN